MPPISATIITRNEAQHIGRAIRSLGVADEIVVVDAGSTDATCDVAAGLGARVIVHPWAGFAAQKNFASQMASHDWILSLDADEEFDGAAQEALRVWKTFGPGNAGYRFARRARYLGRWILHSGWYPDYKVRLFDRRRAEWQGAYVHESVVVRGAIETLPGEILHYTCDSLAEQRERIEFYTDLAAQELFDRGEEPARYKQLLGPAAAFARSFFLHVGVLDGYHGFLIAWMAARYVRRKHAKLAQKFAAAQSAGADQS
jgi:glycosyltransferase involved in cell wall biosynthesis